MNFDEIFERIKLVTNTRTQVELADVLDIRQSSISDAKRRNSVPADWSMTLFEQFGLNPDWLKKGSGPMYLRTDQGYSPMDLPLALHACEDPTRYGGADAKSTIVSVYSTKLGDDNETPASVIGRLTIPQSFMGTNLHVIRVDGSSMEPLIHKGAYVGIETAQHHVASGELYAVRFPYEGIVIKRAFINTQDAKLILRSENTAHPEVALPLEGHEAHVMGRVIWVLQRL